MTATRTVAGNIIWPDQNKIIGYVFSIHLEMLIGEDRFNREWVRAGTLETTKGYAKYEEAESAMNIIVSLYNHSHPRMFVDLTKNWHVASDESKMHAVSPCATASIRFVTMGDGRLNWMQRVVGHGWTNAYDGEPNWKELVEDGWTFHNFKPI